MVLNKSLILPLLLSLLGLDTVIAIDPFMDLCCCCAVGAVRLVQLDQHGSRFLQTRLVSPNCSAISKLANMCSAHTCIYSSGLGPERVRSGLLCKNVFVATCSCRLSNFSICLVFVQHLLRWFDKSFNFCCNCCLLFG